MPLRSTISVVWRSMGVCSQDSTTIFRDTDSPQRLGGGEDGGLIRLVLRTNRPLLEVAIEVIAARAQPQLAQTGVVVHGLNHRPLATMPASNRHAPEDSSPVLITR